MKTTTKPDVPAAISIPFATLPITIYIKGPRYRVKFMNGRQSRDPAFAVIRPEDKRRGSRLRWLAAGAVHEDDTREYKILMAWWTGKRR